jgi:hypothetical protein
MIFCKTQTRSSDGQQQLSRFRGDSCEALTGDGLEFFMLLLQYHQLGASCLGLLLHRVDFALAKRQGKLR